MSQKRQIFKLSILKSLLEDKNSCVSLMQSTRLLALPPFYLQDMKSGVLYLLNAMLKKYDRSLGGIVMGYQNIKVLMDENTGIIPIGTSETEVNISVEFYIFQPKIGSYLEGVINKKSNNHIGCIVHQYFNATILKPEDVLYEDWVCKNLNVGDKIIFKVKDLDFTTLLPLIEGIYDGKNSLEQVKVKPHGNCDTSDVIISDLNKSSQNKTSVPMPLIINKIKTDSKTLDDSSYIKKCKNKKEDLNAADVNLNNNLEESQSLRDLTSAKIKKRKKKNKEKMKFSTGRPYNVKEEGHSNDKDVIVDNICKILQAEESSHKKKKKKKKKKDDGNDEECQTTVNNMEKKEIPPSNVFGKLLHMEEKNTNVFVKVNNVKLGINKNKYQNEEPFPNSNEINECLPSQDIEDNVFYSTQLDPTLSSKKMRISFCSPIPCRAPFESKMDASSPPNVKSSVHLYNEYNRVATEKEMRKKHKKRKREKHEDLEDSHTAKKIKISNTSFLKEKEDAKAEIKSSTRKSILEIMMEQLLTEQLNKSSKEASIIKEKVKKEKKNKKVKVEREESLGINGEERKSDVQSSFSKLYFQELQRMKEKLSNSNKESSVKSKKSKPKLNKQEVSKDMAGEESYKVRNTLHAQTDGTKWSDDKLDIKSVIDKSCKQEIDRVKENKSDTGSIKEKKRKSVTNDQEASRERTHLLLYDKLLNEAKSAMDLEKYQELIRPPATEWGKSKKVNDYSDLFMSSSGKKDSKKKTKRKKQKPEDCQQTYNRFKNGSMYDTAATPEKINPDKSLFSDSEQGQGSPVKTTKEVNGNETVSEKLMLDEFVKEGVKRLKSESNSQSLKSLEKNERKRSRTEERTQISGEKEESLYDKLLRQAKSFIDGGEVSPIKKKKKERKKGDAGFC